MHDLVLLHKALAKHKHVESSAKVDGWTVVVCDVQCNTELDNMSSDTENGCS